MHLEQISHLLQVLLGIKSAENKSIPAINGIHLPPIPSENSLITRTTRFSTHQNFTSASVHLKHTRVSPTNNQSHVQPLKYLAIKSARRAISIQSALIPCRKFKNQAINATSEISPQSSNFLALILVNFQP